MPAPQISIIMPAYNCAPYIADAIRSVLAQTFQDWELVIVDDGSTDKTHAVAEQAMVSHPDRRIVLIQDSHGGCASATAMAIKHAAAPLVTVLDADDWLLPDSLRVITQEFAAHPDISYLWTRWKHSTGRLRCWTRDLPPGKTLKQALLDNWWAASCQRAWRAEAYRLTPGLDTSLTLAVDLQLVAMFSELGWPVRSVNTVTYVYRDHGRQSSKVANCEQKRCHREIIERLRSGMLKC